MNTPKVDLVNYTLGLLKKSHSYEDTILLNEIVMLSISINLCLNEIDEFNSYHHIFDYRVRLINQIKNRNMSFLM